MGVLVAIVLLARGDDFDRSPDGGVVLPSASGVPAPTRDPADPTCTTGRLEWHCVEWAIEGNFSNVVVRDGTIVARDTDDRLIGIDPATGDVRWRLGQLSLQHASIEVYNQHLVVVDTPQDVVVVVARSGEAIVYERARVDHVTASAVVLRRETETVSTKLLLNETGQVAAEFDVGVDASVTDVGKVLITSDSQEFSRHDVRNLAGELLWSLDLERGIPVVLGDLVYVLTEPTESGEQQLRALALDTGSLVWEARLAQPSWQTELVRDVLIVETGKTTFGIDAMTGRRMWQRPNWDGYLAVSDGRLWAHTWVSTGMAALASIDVTTGADRWVIPLHVTNMESASYDRVLRFQDRVAGAGLDGFYLAHADGSRQQFTLHTPAPSSESQFVLLDPPVVAAGDWLYGLNPEVLAPSD